MIHQQVATAPLPGVEDLWSYDLLEYGGELPCSSARSLLYYLASRQTQAVRVVTYNAQDRMAHLEVYGPICDRNGPLWVELKITNSAKTSLADTSISRLSPEEITILRDKLKEHVKKDYQEFPKPGICDAKRILGVLHLPWGR